MINSSTALAALVARFPSNRAFIEAFKTASGIEINETVLSRQLSGTRNLSAAWMAAYTLFASLQN